MNVWMRQWYPYDPVVMNVKLNEAPGWSIPLLNAPPSAVQVWTTLSSFVTVTFVPTVTVNDEG